MILENENKILVANHLASIKTISSAVPYKLPRVNESQLIVLRFVMGVDSSHGERCNHTVQLAVRPNTMTVESLSKEKRLCTTIWKKVHVTRLSEDRGIQSWWRLRVAPHRSSLFPTRWIHRP